MQNKTFKIAGIIFIVLGTYSTLNLLYKLFSGEGPYVNPSDVSGPLHLIIGIILLVIRRKKNVASVTEPPKPKFIQFVLILSFLSLFNIDFSYLMSPNPTFFTIFQLFVDILTLIITLIYIYKLNYLKKDILKWTNLNFGFALLYFFFLGASGNLEDTTSLLYPPFLFALAIGGTLWVIYYKYLVKVIDSKKIMLSE